MSFGIETMQQKFTQRIQTNLSQLTLNKFGRNLLYPNSEDICARRDYVLHRLGASCQQLSILKQLSTSYSNQYLSISDTGQRLDLTLNSIHQLTYCFDNLIFNLASMSDYFGNYMGIIVYGPKRQSIKWSGFVNTTYNKYSDSSFGQVVKEQHNTWFDRLHNYRGDVIHRKAILVEVEGYKNTKLFPTPVDSLHFVINDSLNKYFHLIRKSENRDLCHCAEALFKRTLDGFSEILSESENLEFDKKHQKII